MVSMVSLNLSITQLLCFMIAMSNVKSSAADYSHLPAGYIPYPDLGVAYKVSDVPVVNPEEGRDSCTLEGAQLAVVDTFEKFGYIKSLIPLGEERLHAGIIKVDFEWINVNTGITVPSASIPWGRGEPSRFSTTLFVDRSKNGLADWPRYTARHFVCELPIS